MLSSYKFHPLKPHKTRLIPFSRQTLSIIQITFVGSEGWGKAGNGEELVAVGWLLGTEVQKRERLVPHVSRVLWVGEDNAFC
jgi:hypothetical protein